MKSKKKVLSVFKVNFENLWENFTLGCTDVLFFDLGCKDFVLLNDHWCSELGQSV